MSFLDPPERSFLDPPERMRTVRVPLKVTNPDQLDLASVAPPPVPPELTAAEREATIQERFLEFHGENPHVYEEICLLARRAKRAGATKIGVGMIFEVLRWRHTLRTRGDDFKLNNTLRSRYARYVMENEPDLEGVFEIRELHSP